jgi:hypothetical protein
MAHANAEREAGQLGKQDRGVTRSDQILFLFLFDLIRRAAEN